MAAGRSWLIALGATVLMLGVFVASASAAPLAMEFNEARANVGAHQLSDAPLFAAPDFAAFEAEIDSGGLIKEGELEVPDFSTFITDPVNANVVVEFEIGNIQGSFNQATGVLSLNGTAGGTLTANGHECIVATDPANLTLTTAGSSGGTNPRSGVPFTFGLNGGGAIAGTWEDMSAEPVSPGDNAVCETVEEHIEGPGGIWMSQDDVVRPSAPRLTGTDPVSPGSSGTPRILGTAEAGSTVRVYAGAGCGGAPVASAGAAELASPGIPVAVAEGATGTFSARATDAAGNASACSGTISYTHLKAPTEPVCVVPKLVGKTLARAKTALAAANCTLGKVHRPRHSKGRTLVVKASHPGVGATPASGKVRLRLGPKS